MIRRLETFAFAAFLSVALAPSLAMADVPGDGGAGGGTAREEGGGTDAGSRAGGGGVCSMPLAPRAAGTAMIASLGAAALVLQARRKRSGARR